MRVKLKITDHKFTDEQIIKGLEMCGKEEPCEECPYKGTQCLYTLPRDAADLVKRQKAEIERLNGVSEICGKCHVKYAKKIETARAEAIKEFAERLKKRNRLYCTKVEDAKEMDFVIDTLVKELTEDLK